MNDLRPLHALLQHIGRRRRRLRGLIGVSGIIVAVSAAWLGLFALDWGLQLGRMERAVAVLLAAVALGWAVRKLVLPWWMSRETELHLALLLQKRAGIDTDLVAALQFEAAEAGRWGSPELQAAVMRRVATATPTLPLREDIPPRIVGRRVIVAALALASVTSVALVFPKHTCVFLDRLLLRSAAYPTATRIDEIRIAGQPVRLDRSPAEVLGPLGAAVDFRVTVSGRVPQEGLVQLSAVEARQSSRLPLLPESGTAGTFTASLPLLTDDSECRIRIGDASTGPIVLSPVHPLQARLVFEIREPDYGDGTDRIRRRQEGILQLTVPEGSWVRPWLVSDRRLSRAELHFGDDVTALRRVAEPPPASDATENPAPNDGRTGRPHGAAPAYWWTPEPIPTALGDVTEPVRLEFVMEEEAGSSPITIQAVLRPRPDQPPRIVAESRISLVLPRARPTIFCRAADDRGLVRIDVRAERVRPDGTAEILPTWTLWEADRQVQRELVERFPLDLSVTGAAKGDRLRVYLTAVEQGRGGLPGRSIESTPITLDVTDEQGIMAAMAQLDRKSADQLRQMIDRQLEVGGAP